MALQARLLLVDDDTANRDLLGRRLSRSGYHVDPAEDGAQALDMVHRQPYDLVLLDQMMPGLAGIDVLRQIRQTWSASELPVIMVTAVGDSADIVLALRAGADDYVLKPIDFPIVLARIETRLKLVSVDRELRRTRELYELALRASEEGLWDWDLVAGTVYFSPRWKSMLGYMEEEIAADPEEWFTRLHPADRECVRSVVKAHREGLTASLECEYRIRHRDGRYRWMQNRGRTARDAAGRTIRMAGYQTDITARKTTDALTSLPNRAWLEDELASLGAQNRRAALLLIEMDSFDRVEESLPNGGAGLLLAAIAGRLRDVLASGAEPVVGVAVRTGDHEFGLLQYDAASPAAARQFADHLQAAFAQPFPIERELIFTTASMGIAVGFEPEDDLLRDAHAALRHAREAGCGRREIFRSSMREQELEETRLLNDFRHALERSEFEVHYQPKVDLQNGEITGFEALVRWNRPGHGTVQPAAFIPLAESTGMIVPLGLFVLDRACRDTRELRRTFPKVEVSVNLSGRQFAEPNLVEQISACLEASGLDPEALRLEITETFLVADPDKALHMLCRLRAMGVGIKLDDFGSGYSSFEYLQKFPFDTLKIDRTFVSRMTSNPESLEIVRAIAGLSRSLNMHMVAEGIENRAQLEGLKALGCRYGQGYWFSPPVNFEGLKGLLTDWPSRQEQDTVANTVCLEERPQVH